jgi:hypothetical protein
LIVATQDVSDTVEIRAWKCSDWDHAEVGDTVGQRLGSIRITTVRICFPSTVPLSALDYSSKSSRVTGTTVA